MNNIGERINYLRKSKNLTLKNLADEVGNVSHATIGRMENNSVNPSVNEIVKLCKYFNASTDWLLTGKGGISNEKGEFLTGDEKAFVDKYRMLDKIDRQLVHERMQTLIEKSRVMANRQANVRDVRDVRNTRKIEAKIYDLPVSAGFGTYLGDSDSQYDLLLFDEDYVPKQADYGLRVKGDSMAPLIHDGDIVWVKEQSQVNNGAIGIFIIDDEAYCKKIEVAYGKSGQQRSIRLLSLNPEYEPIIIKEYDY